MVVDTGAAGHLASLRGRGLTVALRLSGERWGLVVTPGSALTDADRAALREHKEALLDLLWAEPHPSDGRAIGWSEPLTETQLRGGSWEETT